MIPTTFLSQIIYSAGSGEYINKFRKQGENKSNFLGSLTNIHCYLPPPPGPLSSKT